MKCGKGYYKQWLTAIGFIALCLWLPNVVFAEQVDGKLPERSQQDIMDHWKQWMQQPKQEKQPFMTEPSADFPYKPGKVRDSYLEQGLNAANFYRYLSGLPGDLSLDSALNEQSQYGAVLVAKTGHLDHTPSQPDNMPKDFYDKGYESTSSSNLYMTSGGENILIDSVKAYMDDSDPSNIDRLGHRRWILSPQMQKIGFGLAHGSADSGYQAYFTPMSVFDDSRTEVIDYNYSLYPNKGAFPIEAFYGGQAWSVQLNPERFQEPVSADVHVELTRLSDSKTWTFDDTKRNAYSSDSYFHADTWTYGNSYAVIFRPDGMNRLIDGDKFAVKITGLKKTDGTPAEIEYETTFFHADPAQRVKNIALQTSQVSVEIGAKIELPAITVQTEAGSKTVDWMNVIATSASDKIRVRDGMITGRKSGSANVTLNYEGKTATLTVNVTTPSTFTDTHHHWAEDAIEWAASQGIVNGYSDGTFKPDAEVTEAEFLTMLFTPYADSEVLQMIDGMAGGGEDAVWSDKYYRYASGFSLGLHASVKDAALRDRRINRAEVAQIIAGLGGRNYASDDDAIRYLLNMGYSTGKTAPTVEGYAGADRLTRAEALVFLQNLQEQGFSLIGRPSTPSVFTDNEKHGGFPDKMIKAVFHADSTIYIKGTVSAAANKTIAIKIHGPSPAVNHIKTYSVTTDANGNFTLTTDPIDSPSVNCYVYYEENSAYWLTVDADSAELSFYRN